MPRPYMRNRPAHDQRLTLLDRQPPRRVDHVQFIAHVDPTSVKFDRQGGVSVTLAVPKEFTDLALEMRFMDGVPLSVDVLRWKVAPDPPGGAGPPAGGPAGLPAAEHPSNPAFRRERNGG